MRFKICCSFPLHELLRFHKQKERELMGEDFSCDTVTSTDNNLALITIMAQREKEMVKNRNYGCFAMEEESKEMLHYAEHSKFHISNLTNCGVYICSVRLFHEYGLSTIVPESEEDGHDKYHTVSYLTHHHPHHQPEVPLSPAVPQQPSTVIDEAISLKDILMPMCSKKKAYVYEMDMATDFVRDLSRHEDKLTC